MFTFHPDSDEKSYESSKSFAETFSPSSRGQIHKRGDPRVIFEVTFASHFISAYWLCC